MDDSEDRAPAGNEKSSLSSALPKRLSASKVRLSALGLKKKLPKASGRDCSPVAYPILISVQLLFGLQYPNTPKSMFLKVASGIALIMGVDRTESSMRTKATKTKTARGVAGRNIFAMD